MAIQKEDGWWFQIGKVEDGTDEFDREFWNAQKPEVKFQAFVALLERYSQLNGGSADEFRLQRPFYEVKRIGG